MDTRKELIEKLRKDILLWQGYKPQSDVIGRKSGLGEIENAFPDKVFPTMAIHEFISIKPEHSSASDGFIAALLSVLMKDGAACLWISTARRLFPVSLRMFNVDPERIIFIDVAMEKDVLWIMEEALKCEGLAAVIAEVDNLNLIESRRLQLAVEQTGVTGFIIRKNGSKAINSIATARWKITPVSSKTEDGMPGVGFPRWNVELMKVRNGNPGKWTLEWRGDRFAEIPKISQEEAIWFDFKRKQLG